MSHSSPGGHLSRRSLLKGGVAAAMGAALAPMLAACGSGGGNAATGTSSPTTSGASTTTGAASSSAAGTATSGSAVGSATASPSAASSSSSFTGELAFDAWDFQPDTIKKFVAAWSTRTGVPTKVEIIPGSGYNAAIQTRLRSGAHPDVYYNYAYNAQKFVKAQWAAPLAGFPDADTMLADMFPSARQRYLGADGRMVSAPYFSATYMTFYNTTYLQRAGLTNPPQTLQEIYDQCEKLRSAGVSKTPYVAFWTKDFCEEYLNAYLLAEGITPFDEQGNAAFADDKKTVDVLTWWQRMYQSGLTPKSILTDDPGTLTTYMAGGTAAFMNLHHYFLSSIHQAKGAQAGNVAMVSSGGASGKSLQIGEVLQMGALTDKGRQGAAWELMKYYGWKDWDGKFSVPIQWAKAAGLAAPYVGFFKDPDVIAAFPSYYDLAALADVFDKSDVVPARTLPWYPDFQSKVGDLVQSMLVGQATPAATVDALAKAVKQAQGGGGI